MSTFLTIILTILIFGFLVVTHEWGHFIVAIKCGVTVDEFSIGFGPLIWQTKTKHTMFSIRAIPLGGFCKMPDDTAEDEEHPRQEGVLGLYDVSPLKRILICLAGPMMNLITAVLIFFMIFCFNGTDASTTLSSVVENEPAYLAGITAGDTIIKIDDVDITEWSQVSELIDSSKGNSLHIVVRSADGSNHEYDVTPLYDKTNDDYYIGIVSSAKFVLSHAITNSFLTVFEYMAMIFDVFVGIFRGLYGVEAFSGPIGVAVAVGTYMSYGLIYMLYLVASLAVSIGFFNLLPIPALDGSKILFALIQMVVRKPIDKKYEMILDTIGMIALMIFAAFIAYLDIKRYL